MLRIEHQLRVFVFQVLHSGVQYLLLRQRPMLEWPFGPVVGTIRPDEHMQDAILREVHEETGLPSPVHLLELASPDTELFGDVSLVEWPYAYQAGAPSSPRAQVVPGPSIGEFAWMGFEQAFEKVGNDRDRNSLIRLQIQLQG